MRLSEILDMFIPLAFLFTTEERTREPHKSSYADECSGPDNRPGCELLQHMSYCLLKVL